MESCPCSHCQIWWKRYWLTDKSHFNTHCWIAELQGDWIKSNARLSVAIYYIEESALYQKLLTRRVMPKDIIIIDNFNGPNGFPVRKRQSDEFKPLLDLLCCHDEVEIVVNVCDICWTIRTDWSLALTILKNKQEYADSTNKLLISRSCLWFLPIEFRKSAYGVSSRQLLERRTSELSYFSTSES